MFFLYVDLRSVITFVLAYFFNQTLIKYRFDDQWLLGCKLKACSLLLGGRHYNCLLHLYCLLSRLGLGSLFEVIVQVVMEGVVTLRDLSRPHASALFSLIGLLNLGHLLTLIQ